MISNEDDLAEEPVDECDNCHAPIDGEHAATSDVCHDCWCATQLRANSAEQELRETAGELEKGARLLKNRISQCNELQTRLTEATALLAYHKSPLFPEAGYERELNFARRRDAFLSRAPAQPAAPTPPAGRLHAEFCYPVCHGDCPWSQPAAPEPSADLSERAHAEMWMRKCATAESQLAAVRNAVLVSGISEQRADDAGRLARAIRALLTHAPSPDAGEWAL